MIRAILLTTWSGGLPLGERANDGTPGDPVTLYSIGHSVQTAEEFVARLREAGIRRLTDVRRSPWSRRNPQFNRENLAATLAAADIEYRHAETLGGMRDALPDSPHTALDESIRGYADHMDSPAYREALRELIVWGTGARTAFMCAEQDFTHCHRRLLADALVVRGVRVLHLTDGEPREHTRSAIARIERVERAEGIEQAARVEPDPTAPTAADTGPSRSDRLVYDAGILELDL